MKVFRIIPEFSLKFWIWQIIIADLIHTVKPVLSGHSKIDKTKILMKNDSLMKVESIAECSPWSIAGSILQYLLPALSDNWSWKPIFGLFESGRFRQVLLYVQLKTIHHLNLKLFGSLGILQVLSFSNFLSSEFWNLSAYIRLRDYKTFSCSTESEISAVHKN